MITDTLLARGMAQGGSINAGVSYTVPAGSTVTRFNMHIAGVQGGGSAYIYISTPTSYIVDTTYVSPGTVYNKTFKMAVAAGHSIGVGVTAAVLGTCGVHISGKVKS